MTARRLLMAAALMVAVWFGLFADKTPSNDVTAPVGRPPTGSAAVMTSLPAQASATRLASATGEPQILLLAARSGLIGGTDVDGRKGLFNSQSWAPPKPIVAPSAPLPAPAAPPLPFIYLGKQASDGKWEVYLARGEAVVIVHADSVIDNIYRVDAIAPPILSLTYLPLKQVQQLAIGVHD